MITVIVGVAGGLAFVASAGYLMVMWFLYRRFSKGGI